MTTKVVFYIGRFTGDNEEEQNEIELNNNINNNSRDNKTFENPIKIITREKIIPRYEKYINFINNIF